MEGVPKEDKAVVHQVVIIVKDKLIKVVAVVDHQEWVKPVHLVVKV